jgi:glutathione S-transferase
MPFRPLAQLMVRRRIRKRLDLQGFGHHSRSEQVTLAIADINALATLLGDKAYLMGEKPCGADAAVFGFVASFLIPEFATEIRAAAEKHQNLVAYRDRILRDYFDR